MKAFPLATCLVTYFLRIGQEDPYENAPPAFGLRQTSGIVAAGSKISMYIEKEGPPSCWEYELIVNHVIGLVTERSLSDPPQVVGSYISFGLFLRWICWRLVIILPWSYPQIRSWSSQMLLATPSPFLKQGVSFCFLILSVLSLFTLVSPDFPFLRWRSPCAFADSERKRRTWEAITSCLQNQWFLAQICSEVQQDATLSTINSEIGEEIISVKNYDLPSCLLRNWLRSIVQCKMKLWATWWCPFGTVLNTFLGYDSA